MRLLVLRPQIANAMSSICSSGSEDHVDEMLENLLDKVGVHSDASWTAFDLEAAIIEHGRAQWFPGKCSWAGRMCTLPVEPLEPKESDHNSARAEYADGRESHEDECPICLDLLYKPVQTNCGHRFCSACWDRASSAQSKQQCSSHLDDPLSVRCPACRAPVDKGSIVPLDDLNNELQKRWPDEWAHRAHLDEQQCRLIRGSLVIEIPHWTTYDCAPEKLSEPPNIHLILGSRGTARRMDVIYSTNNGIHIVSRLGPYSVHNLIIQKIGMSQLRSMYARMFAIPIKLIRNGQVAASVVECKHGVLVCAFAGNMLSKKDAMTYKGDLIAVLDLARGLLAVRDPASELGQSLLAWLLLRCIGLDATGIQFDDCDTCPV